MRGTHLFKTGFSFIKMTPRSLAINKDSWGRWDFTGNMTGSDLGDMLLGLPYRSRVSGSREESRPRGIKLRVLFPGRLENYPDPHTDPRYSYPALRPSHG